MGPHRVQIKINMFNIEVPYFLEVGLWTVSIVSFEKSLKGASLHWRRAGCVGKENAMANTVFEPGAHGCVF